MLVVITLLPQYPYLSLEGNQQKPISRSAFNLSRLRPDIRTPLSFTCSIASMVSLSERSVLFLSYSSSELHINLDGMVWAYCGECVFCLSRNTAKRTFENYLIVEYLYRYVSFIF